MAAVRPRTLAERWLTARPITKDDAAPWHDAAAWLADQGVDPARGLVDVRDLWTEAWVLGERSAGAAVAGSGVDWGGWTPGDAEAARLLVSDRVGLQLMLERADVTIASIGAHRLDELARVLADAVGSGDSVDTLAGALQSVLDDPAWAEMVAVTETSRAVSTATLASYQRDGVEASEWMTALDQRVCSVCAGNEGDGPVRVGQAFGSGDTGPPAHPSCRCALSPVLSSLEEVSG